MPDPPLEGYIQYADPDPFEDNTGPFFYHPHTAKSAFRATPRHCNSFGIVHGGALMAFADFSLFVTAREYTFESTGDHYVTLHFNVDFLSSAKAGTLIEAEGAVEKVSSDGEIIIVNSKLYQGDRKLAVFRGVMKKARSKATRPPNGIRTGSKL